MKTVLFLLSLVFLNQAFASVSGVDWHKGSVEEAMALAKKKNLPMFLYWGAVWCPPCNQIKKTIFSKTQFHQESKNFVSVYLDGDKTMAQKWGGHFGAVGYPTMMILNSAGEEISRMPGGLNVTEYVDLMKKTRENQLTIGELFAKAKAKKATLVEYQRLAGYSWDQDKNLQETILNEKNKASTYYALFNNAPKVPSAIKAQFFLRYQMTKLKEDKKYRADKHDVKVFTQILNDKKAWIGNIGMLSYYPTRYKELFSKGMGEKTFKTAYLKVLKEIRDDEQVDLNSRYSTFYAEITLNTVEKKTPKKIQAEVKKWTEKIDRESKDAYSRQSNITTAIWILRKANLIQEAKKLATKELKVSISPYYIMRYLASIELELDNKDEALNWSKKAWQTAKGGSTRFEWGTSYLLNLMKHKPKRAKEISSTTVNVFKELLNNKDAFEGRNKRRLVRLKKSFATWKKDHVDSFNGMSANLNNNCRTAVDNEIKKLCMGWVKRL